VQIKEDTLGGRDRSGPMFEIGKVHLQVTVNVCHTGTAEQLKPLSRRQRHCPRVPKSASISSMDIWYWTGITVMMVLALVARLLLIKEVDLNCSLNAAQGLRTSPLTKEDVELAPRSDGGKVFN
jgi:hypothetical protein